MSSFRHLILPGGFELSRGSLHRKDGYLIELSVYPDFDFGYIVVLLLGEGEDFRTDVFLGDAVGVVLRDSTQTDQVTPDTEAVAAEVELVFLLQPVVFLVAIDRVGTHEVLFERKNFYGKLRDSNLRFAYLSAVLLDQLEGMAV